MILVDPRAFALQEVDVLDPLARPSLSTLCTSCIYHFSINLHDFNLLIALEKCAFMIPSASFMTATSR